MSATQTYFNFRSLHHRKRIMNNIAKKIAVGVAIFVAAVGVICIIVCTAALSSNKSLDNIPSLSLIRTNGSEWGTSELKGYNEEQLSEIWGEPDGMLSGFWGSVWKTDGNDEIVVYYNENSTVEHVNYIHNMKAKIIEVNGTTLLLEPCAGELELRSADRITVSYGSLELDESITAQFTEGAVVMVGYDGMIAESYPAQITARYGITPVTD